MPKRSRKLGAVGTEVNLLPAAASSVGEKSAAGAAVEPSFEFRGENESGQPLSAVLAEAVDRIRSVTGADGAVIALMGAWGLICSASTGTAPGHWFATSVLFRSYPRMSGKWSGRSLRGHRV